MKLASDVDKQTVLNAVHAGDPIPSGFAYAPYDPTGPVYELDDDDHANITAGGHVVAGTAVDGPTTEAPLTAEPTTEPAPEPVPTTSPAPKPSVGNNPPANNPAPNLGGDNRTV